MAQTEGDLAASQLARQLFPHARTLAASRVQQGVSTWVYRITQDENIFYLRILPEENASFAPEVYVHNSLLARGLHVPEIVYFEHYNAAFQRSVIVTTAITGAPIKLDAGPETVALVLRQAGRELALLNELPVDGFGWVQRDTDSADEVRGEYPTYRAWMMAEIDHALSIFARRELLPPPKLTVLVRLLEEAIEQFGDEPPTLAHGDFDGTHIFHVNGQYMGIIDFGEIRGANRLYDLGHFAIENAHFLPALLEGYQEVSPLPVGYEAQIRQGALLVAVNRAGRRLARSAIMLDMDQRVIEQALNRATFF